MIHQSRRRAVMVLGIAVTFCPTPLLAFRAGFVDAGGNSVFSEQFVRDYQAADDALRTTRSVEPFLKLLAKCRNPNECAELELSIGVIYCQRTGFVDPGKAVKHLTNALGYRLPEKVYLDTLLWRAGSLEQLGKLDEARRDHLRGLLACSDYATPSDWPDLAQPNVGFSIEPINDTEAEARRDYERYRAGVDFQRHVKMQRYYFVEAVKRIGSKSPLTDEQLLKVLADLTPDARKHEVVLQRLRSANKRPWP